MGVHSKERRSKFFPFFRWDLHVHAAKQTASYISSLPCKNGSDVRGRGNLPSVSSLLKVIEEMLRRNNWR